MATTSFLAYFLLFLLASSLAFCLPGVAVLGKEKIEPWEKLVLGTVVGFVLFTLVSYLLMILRLTILIIPVVLLVDLIFFRSFLSLLGQLKLPPKKELFILLSLLMLGTLGQLAVIAPSGRMVGGELLFWSAHGHDGPWHISLMNEIAKGWPLQNPVFAGERLVNYHFFSDLAPAIFQKYLGLPALDLYFRFFPFLYALLFGATAFLLGKKVGKSFSSGVWGFIFIILGGSFGYIVTLIQKRGIGGESVFWATQPQSSIGNPPQIVSNILVLSLFSLLFFYKGGRKKTIFVVSSLLAGTLAVFKVYAGVVILGALLLSGFWQIAIPAGIISALLYLPNTKGSTSFLIFQPWWYIRTMVVEPSRLNWIDLELRRQFYLARGGWRSVLRIIEYEGVALAIFFVGNLGTRVLGLLSFLRSPKIITTTIILSFAAPLLFLQRGVASNTSQFLQYFVLLFGILAGVSFAKLLRKVKPAILKVFLSLLVITLTVPTQIALIHDFYSRAAFAKINAEELSALSLIKKEYPGNTTILTPPYNKYTDLKMPVPEIWDWFDTAYVSAFSERRVYLADTEQVDIMGYDYKGRLTFQEKIFSNSSAQEIAALMKEKNLTLLYFPKALAPKADFNEKYFRKIVENRRVEVWAVR